MLVWLAMAVIGLFVGGRAGGGAPVRPSATTTVLLDNPGETQGAELQTDAALRRALRSRRPLSRNWAYSRRLSVFSARTRSGLLPPQITDDNRAGAD